MYGSDYALSYLRVLAEVLNILRRFTILVLDLNQQQCMCDFDYALFYLRGLLERILEIVFESFEGLKNLVSNQLISINACMILIDRCPLSYLQGLLEWVLEKVLNPSKD